MRTTCAFVCAAAIGHLTVLSRESEIETISNPGLPKSFFDESEKPEKPKQPYGFQVLNKEFYVGRDEVEVFFDSFKKRTKPKDPRLDRENFKGKIRKGGVIS